MEAAMNKICSLISTHAPYTEGDDNLRGPYAFASHFNSRPLYRGRLKNGFSSPVDIFISTHAPYTEGDNILLIPR